MALPKLTTPTFELEVPSSDEKIQYRPFLVKEEKILLMAMESNKPEDIIEAVKQIVSECTFNKLDLGILPMFDVEYIFLQIRSKSVGEVSKLKLLCPDDNKTYGEVEVKLDEVKVQVDDKHTNKVMIDDKRKLGVVLKYPSLSLFKNPKSISEKPEVAFKLVVNCIDHIFEGEKVYPAKDSTEKELTSFLEDLTQKSFGKIKTKTS